MLQDFFRINLPYGIARNVNGEWMAFNREYMPLGYNDILFKGTPGYSFLDMPIYTKYRNVTKKLLLELACNKTSIDQYEQNEIIVIYLYDDSTNPLNHASNKKELWDIYFEKLKKLARLEVK